MAGNGIYIDGDEIGISLGGGPGIYIDGAMINAVLKYTKWYYVDISSADGFYPVFQTPLIRNVVIRKTDLETGTVTNITTGAVKFEFVPLTDESDEANKTMKLIVPRGIWHGINLLGTITVANTNPMEIIASQTQRLIPCKCKFVLSDDIPGVSEPTLFVDPLPNVVMCKDKNNSNILYEVFFTDEKWEIIVRSSNRVSFVYSQVTTFDVEEV